MDVHKLLEAFNELQNRPKLKCIKVNPQYLPTFLNDVQSKKADLPKGVDGYMSLIHGVPLYHDKTVETFELVYSETQ